tara:strand:+ start:171 stop:401 length:231 start_codon:yes stop_codon:yes gene_type:complete
MQSSLCLETTLPSLTVRSPNGIKIGTSSSDPFSLSSISGFKGGSPDDFCDFSAVSLLLFKTLLPLCKDLEQSYSLN